MYLLIYLKITATATAINMTIITKEIAPIVPPTIAGPLSSKCVKIRNVYIIDFNHNYLVPLLVVLMLQEKEKTIILAITKEFTCLT